MLFTVPEYAKVCKIVRIMSENSKALCTLSRTVRNIFESHQKKMEPAQVKPESDHEEEDVNAATVKSNTPSKLKKRRRESDIPSAKKRRKSTIKTEH